MSISKKLRENRLHYVATVALLLVVAAIVGWTWWRAPVRHVQHVQARDSFNSVPVTSKVPTSLIELWRVPVQEGAPAAISPIIVEGVAIVPDTNGIRAIDVHTGKEAWSYHRDIPLCTAMASKGHVVAVFRGQTGCGEVTSLLARNGKYAATRRSLQADSVAPIRSNDNTGIMSDDALELWRTDLVRTLEYGSFPAPSEPGLQPHPGCTIVDAMTRKKNTAVINSCPDGFRLVMQSAEPEESREPKVTADVSLPGPARLVAIGISAVTVRMGEDVVSYGADGQETSRFATPVSVDDGAASANVTADLPHHMTWFSGHDVIGLRPQSLDFAFSVPGAIGTPVAVGNRAIVPFRDGFAVVNWDNGHVDYVVPRPRAVDAGDVPESAVGTDSIAVKPIVLGASGEILVEKRNDVLVGYLMVTDPPPPPPPPPPPAPAPEAPASESAEAPAPDTANPAPEAANPPPS